MNRRRLAWLVALPLAMAGLVAAHAVAYVVVVPGHHAREEVLAGTGHGYLALLPGLALVGAVLVLSGLAGQVLRGRRAQAARAEAVGGAWPFAVLPPLAFAVQEHVERLLHDGVFPFGAALEPTFALGLALQLPFGLAAWLAARLLLAAGAAIGVRLARCRSGPRRVRGLRTRPPRAAAASPRIAVLAARAAGRAPPAAAV